jgi:hypothetical protein
MKPGPRTGPIGRNEEGRLHQMENKMGSVKKDEQSKTLDTKRNLRSDVAVVASISKEEDPSTMKQPSRWQGAITTVVNINRMSRKERAYKIDEIVQQQHKDTEIETKLVERVTSTGTGKFNDLDQVLDFINTNVGIGNAGEYITDKLEANEFLERVLSRTGSTLSRTGSILPEVDFTSSLTNKKYKNEEEYGFFDDFFRFTLNKDCYIIYELKKENSSVYIEMIKCEPNDSLPRTSNNFLPRTSNNFLPKIKQSVKGSGRVMLYDLLHFLTTNRIIGYPQNNDETIVCLTPEPFVGREEHSDPKKLYTYYQEMGFKKDKEDRYWCGKISTIMTEIDSIVGITDTKKKDELTSAGLLCDKVEEENQDYGGGRRKRTKKKRTRRKTRKSRKSRRRR